jgi:hypothetical protein
MSYFDGLLKERSSPYEIDVELEVRKLFEKNTDYTFEFQKNDNKYEYDISVFKYYINGSDYKKKIIAYIEIEVSETWQTTYPDYWKTYSFLKRKVFKYSYENQCFSTELKENAENTIYIIFNKTLTDAICCDIITISKFNNQKSIVTGNERQDTFLREPLNSFFVVRGLNECFKKINEFIKLKQ